MGKTFLIIVALALLTLSLGGCAPKAVDVDNPIDIAVPEYDRVFDAAILVLRERRYVVDRKDRRFGIVTTEPQISASVFEPWRSDNLGNDETVESTLNFQRHIVRVSVAPAAPEGAAPNPNAPKDYQLHVIVDIQRRYHPPRQLVTSAMGVVSVRSADSRHRATYTERGLEESYWATVGRDELLEQQLVAAILRRSVQLDQPLPVASAPQHVK
ncbi:MAG: hypothetical protein GC162_03995 [Planctomycetes bacterium]|nr:hypothetical protein [Planctomycetota bacterium]